LVKVLFDTSIIVAALVEDHPNHLRCFPWLEQVKSEEIQGFISTHTIAEVYAVLTGLPRRPRISPRLAQRLLTENFNNFNPVVLTAEDYQIVLTRMVNLNLSGGGIYDALIAQSAMKVEVDILLTLNPKDFMRLGEDIAKLVQVPQ
jgi:predicted nucleic acid-binding protein